MRNMKARQGAREKGERYYSTGIPCKSGHAAPRATISGACTVCTAIAAKAWAAQRPEKMAGYTAAYRARNPEKARANDELTLRQRRKANPEKYHTLSNARYARAVAAQGGREVRPSNQLPIDTLQQRLTEQYRGALTYVSGYTNANAPATFRCTLHALEIDALPHNTSRGANPCPRCNHMKSAGEQRVADYLSTFTKVVQRDRTLLKPKELDIYLPEHKLAVEYSGMFWHSHGDASAEKADKLKHFQKYQDCAAQGVRLLTIFESEWEESEPALRRLLRNAVGKGRGKLMARKCALKKVPTPEARVFYDRYHPQGGAGGGEHYGLYWKDKLVACMRFAFGNNDRGASAKKPVWTLGRYATRVTVAGAASRLFKAFVDEHEPIEVKSFSDNRYFSGDMYARLGFTLEEEVVPDYQVWSPKKGTKPKPHYQRRALPKRLLEHGMDDAFNPATDQRTEAEMTYLMGCRRIYDCGKKKWLWTTK